MAHHHTKDKGDLGVAKVYADLVGRGFTVLLPATEHAPFDLVAYADGTFLRVQVKYRTIVNGVIRVGFASAWSDRHGVHKRQLDKSEVDLLTIYCPETDECYYIDPATHGGSVCLRITPPSNNQRQGVLFAADHLQLPWSTLRGVGAGGVGSSDA